jgi:formylglycine-generating enzyme required for sulfatase activity
MIAAALVMMALSATAAVLQGSEVIADMVAIPAGSFVRGRSHPERLDEAPPHRIYVSAFYLDKTLVSRADFTRFTTATGYLTTAERQGYGVGASEGMNDWEWERIPKSSWRRPFWEATPDTAAFLREDAPVVMVSYKDAVAYCKWAGKRLPTEAEWEYAMRAGRSGTRYPWGDAPERQPGKLGLNFWQGDSHRHNLREDGYVYVSPVRAFPANDWGLYDPVGNVWQWTADWYAADTYARLARAPTQLRKNPRGPVSGEKRVVRGGSWWCGACTCEGNGLFYRGKSAPDAAFSNLGFRCARDAGSAS